MHLASTVKSCAGQPAGHYPRWPRCSVHCRTYGTLFPPSPTLGYNIRYAKADKTFTLWPRLMLANFVRTLKSSLFDPKKIYITSCKFSEASRISLRLSGTNEQTDQPENADSAAFETFRGTGAIGLVLSDASSSYFLRNIFKVRLHP